MADKATVERLRAEAKEIRKDLLRLCHQTLIHIGGDLSAADLMTAIWQYAMHYDAANPKWEERDRFVLSKGHASAVTSFEQVRLGCYKKEDVYREYATDFGRFGMHSCNLINPHVEVSSGSLGHGLPVATGIAKALQLRHNTTSRVYVVTGDGELDEGTMWEAFMWAAKEKLGNLVVFCDVNKLQFDGYTNDICPSEPLDKKLEAFNWRVRRINGHDMAALVDEIDALPAPDSGIPTVIICDTVKGKGVSFMENQILWHAGMLGDADYEAAVAEVEAAYERGE